MIPWVLLDTAIVPGDGGEMRLYQHDRDFSIRVGNYELMNNRLHSSEDELLPLQHTKTACIDRSMTITARVENHSIALPADVVIADGTMVEIHTLENTAGAWMLKYAGVADDLPPVAAAGGNPFEAD